jgi:hypothetical protein
MATVGLKGLWGLEQLDKTGLATWKLGLILMGGSLLVGVPIALLLGYLDPTQSEGILEGSSATILLLSSSGLGLFVTLALSRTTESDLYQLTLIDRSIEDAIRLLRPRMHILFPSIIFCIIFFMTLFFAPKMIQTESSAIERFAALNSGGIQGIVNEYVLGPLLGLIGGVSLASYLTQVRSLTHAAHCLKIDLLQLSQCSNIANPLIRFIIVCLLTLTTGPILMLVDPATSRAILWIILAFALVLTPMVLLYAHPVLILRNRIKEEKVRELDIVFQALEGNNEVIKSGRIKSRDVPMSTGDLLIQRMFIESLWEWPIAAHVQKLVLFGLLPPLAWVLAAMIENAMY